MRMRDEIRKRIEKKEREIAEWDQTHRIRVQEARGYVQGLQDMLRMLPKQEMASEEVAGGGTVPAPGLRHGTTLAKAHDALKAAGRPLHLTELLTALGRPIDRQTRAALGGSLSAYVRRGEIFKKVGPNMFALRDDASSSAVEPGAPTAEAEPPEDFGREDEPEDDQRRGRVVHHTWGAARVRQA